MSGMTNEQKIIKREPGLLELAEHLGNITESCKIFDYFRNILYRFKQLYEVGAKKLSRGKADERAAQRIGSIQIKKRGL
jgi:hypothetical protein